MLQKNDNMTNLLSFVSAFIIKYISVKVNKKRTEKSVRLVQQPL